MSNCVGAGKIKTGKVKENKKNDEMYMEVELLTPVVNSEKDLKYISPSELRSILNKTFFLARTIKVPYLSEEEAKKVVDRLKEKYQTA